MTTNNPKRCLFTFPRTFTLNGVRDLPSYKSKKSEWCW